MSAVLAGLAAVLLTTGVVVGLSGEEHVATYAALTIAGAFALLAAFATAALQAGALVALAVTLGAAAIVAPGPPALGLLFALSAVTLGATGVDRLLVARQRRRVERRRARRAGYVHRQ
jgi:hypothetical protein